MEVLKMSSTLGPGHGPNHLTALATSGKHIWFLFSQGLVGGRRKRLVMHVPQGCLGSESQECPGVTQLWAGTAAASASDAEPGSAERDPSQQPAGGSRDVSGDCCCVVVCCDSRRRSLSLMKSRDLLAALHGSAARGPVLSQSRGAESRTEASHSSPEHDANQ